MFSKKSEVVQGRKNIVTKEKVKLQGFFKKSQWA